MENIINDVDDLGSGGVVLVLCRTTMIYLSKNRLQHLANMFSTTSLLLSLVSSCMERDSNFTLNESRNGSLKQIENRLWPVKMKNHFNKTVATAEEY